MSAIFDGEHYRLRLDREVQDSGPVVAMIGVNPSLAGAEANDQTIRKDLGFATRLGWQRIIKINKFAHIATDVRELAATVDPIGASNDAHILQALIEADFALACWGTLSKLPTRLRTRWLRIVELAEQAKCELMCLDVALDGHPKHTLMLPYTLKPRRWHGPEIERLMS